MAGFKLLNAQDEWKQFQQMTLLASEKFSVSCIDAPEGSVEVRDEPDKVIQPLFKQIQQANIADKLCFKLQTAKLKGKEKCHETTLQNCSVCKGALYQHEGLWVPVNDELILELIQEVHVPPSGRHKGIN